MAHTSVKNCGVCTSSHFSFLFTKPIAAENNMTDDIPTHQTGKYAVKTPKLCKNMQLQPKPQNMQKYLMVFKMCRLAYMNKYEMMNMNEKCV
jgi:hypothetical protein